MIPLALMAAGTALQVWGTYNANMNQADAEAKNADFYNKQADFALYSQAREAALAAEHYSARKGAQVSAYAKGGIDVSSGSAAITIAQTLANQTMELNAIERKGQLDYALAKARAHGASATADSLRDPMNNFMQAGATVLTNYARAGAPSFGKTTGTTVPAAVTSTPQWGTSVYQSHGGVLGNGGYGFDGQWGSM